MAIPRDSCHLGSATCRPLRRTFWCAALFVVWLAAAVWGSWALLDFSLQPGEAPEVTPVWPAGSRLNRGENKPLLVVFFHPKCPCSRATLEELSVLLARSRGLDVRAVFVSESDPDASLEEGGLWKQASRLPGVVPCKDPGGIEAAAFGGATSGDAFLFDAGGNLVFRGGLTVARGHSGDNLGVDTVAGLLEGKPASTTRTPVFGCALANSDGPP
jgi:hypothetical protein